MSPSRQTGPRAAAVPTAADKARLQEIGRLQDRLDQREAELAAFTAMARLRHAGELREQARPLLREMAEIIGELERLILEDATPADHGSKSVALTGAWRNPAQESKRRVSSVA